MTAVVTAILAIVALVVIAATKRARRGRQRWEDLPAYAQQCGWAAVPAGTPLPGPVAEAAASRRVELVLGTRLGGFDAWLVWHRWTETSSLGEGTTTKVHDLTRYYLATGRPCPDVRVTKRTRIGASLKPVRGIGTGFPEFDRRFLIRSGAGTQARGLLTPDLSRAMLAGDLPVWHISEGILITVYPDRPQPDNLQHRADAIAQIARLLG